MVTRPAGLVIQNVNVTPCSDIIITGDMSFDFNTMNSHNRLNFVNVNNMSALINKPTRITPTYATVLDQF